MNFRKSLIFFSILFPLMLAIGLLVTFAFSLQFHENFRVDWLAAVIIALVLDIFFTWREGRDAKKQKGTA